MKVFETIGVKMLASLLFLICLKFGEDVSVAPSVALVSERNTNQSTPTPQVYPSVSGDHDPAAALWGNQEYTKARWKTFLNITFELVKYVVAYISGWGSKLYIYCGNPAKSFETPHHTQ